MLTEELGEKPRNICILSVIFFVNAELFQNKVD